METLPTLPDAVLQVESPLKWIENIASKPLEKRGAVKKLVDSFEQVNFCKSRKWNSGKLSREEAAFSYHNPQMNKLVAGPINLASMCVYANNLDKALIFLQDAEQVSNACLVGDHKRVRKVVKYSIEVIRWSISGLKLGQQETSGGVADKDNQVLSRQSISKFRETWGKLMKDNKSKATVEYLKARLKISMGVPDDAAILKYLNNATQLDPEYFLWHHELYYFYRDIRLKTEKADDSVESWVSISDEERLACAQSYKIRPTVLLNIFTMARMLKEDLWVKSRKVSTTLNGEDTLCCWGTEENESLDRCLNMFSEALEIANFQGYQSWAERIKLQQARALLFIKHNDKERMAMGEEILLKECPERFPESSTVFNKLGTHYFLKAQAAMKSARELARKAQENYKLSIEKASGNFHLLMDYILFLRFHPLMIKRHYVDLLEMVNKALQLEKGEQQQQQEIDLEILRGCIIWIYNPEYCRRLEHREEACEIWVNLLKKYPGAMDKLVDYMKSPPFTVFLGGRKINVDIDHFDLVLELNKMRKTLEGDHETRDEETLQAIFNLWVLGEMELPPAPPIPIEKEVAEKNFNKESKGKYVIPQRNNSNLTGKSTVSAAADLDNNWRK